MLRLQRELGKPAQRSSNHQVEWLHLRPCLVPSWCGTSRNVWNLASPRDVFQVLLPRVASPAILPKRKAGMKMKAKTLQKHWYVSAPFFSLRNYWTVKIQVRISHRGVVLPWYKILEPRAVSDILRAWQ